MVIGVLARFLSSHALRERKVKSIAVLMIGVATALQVVSAQETINNASVSGRVIDQTGAAVEGAIVSARQKETNATNSANTDREGRFRFPYLKVGSYEITIRQRGFAPARDPTSSG